MPVTAVEWLFPDGAGGGRDGAAIVRLAGGLPGDVVRWSPAGKKGSSTVGAIEAIEEPSPERVTPPCPWDATCGGCDLAALSAEGRRRALARSARQAFNLPSDPLFVASPRETAHRARIKLAIDGTNVGYRPEGSHGMVAIETCGIARPEVQAAIGRLRVWAATPGNTADLASVEIRSDGTRAVFAFASTGRACRREALAELGDVALDGGTIAGDPRLVLTVAGLSLRTSPKSFYQVNLEIDELLVAHVRDRVVELGAERVLDLYAGIGNLSLPIAARGVPVVAVDREGQAMADLRSACGSLAVEAIESDAARFDVSRVAFDVAVIDPPRAGAPGIVDRLVRQRPKGLVYVACDAVNAARDLKAADRAGYRITDVRCFDMFPSTRHFETVITLVRATRGNGR